MPAASSRRLRSLHAGFVLLYSRGGSPSWYQPTPKPSPFVVVAPRRACKLWSISERSRLRSSSSRRIGVPEYASQRHIDAILSCRSAHPRDGREVLRVNLLVGRVVMQIVAADHVDDLAQRALCARIVEQEVDVRLRRLDQAGAVAARRDHVG